MTSTTNVKVEKVAFLVEKSCKTVIDFDFGRHDDLSTLKSDVYLRSLFWVDISSCLHLNEVNNCILFGRLSKSVN